jgi:signal transduction histidine kinase
MLADARNQVVRFNSAAERILDLYGEKLIGKPLARVAGLREVTWATAVDTWSHTAENDPADGFLSQQIELGQKVVNVRLSPVRTKDEFLGTVFVFRDITKEYEADRLKSEFISNVSHELRTPMTSIKGFADLLSMGAVGPVTDQQKDFILKIKGNADRLGVLVDDLLNISVYDSGKEQLDVKEVDLTRVLQTVVNNLEGRSEHDQKQMAVSLTLEPELPPVMGDPNKLTQIFTNIADNAFNYTYAGGSIGIAAQRQEKDTILVSISDTGIGIPDEFKDRIWDRFGRYEEHALVMDVAGTGLGLPIVKTLVEMHHGQVWFESELGKGTTFFVSLPLVQPGQ